VVKVLEKRVNANDANAINQLGVWYLHEDERFSITKDTDKAIELLHRAAELGSAQAYHSLGVIFDNGDGVDEDKVKAKQYFEKAAMGGFASSRLNLGNFDAQAGSFDRAIKHWLIAASCGDIRAVGNIKRTMDIRKATRDDYAQALRGYKQSVNEVKSDNRDRAAAYSGKYKYLFDA
jgi:TPR repeat protein